MTKMVAFLVALLCASVAHAASYTMNRTHHATTILSIVDTITPANGLVCVQYKVMNFSNTRLFWRTDGTNPAVDQDGSFVVPPSGEIYYYQADYNNPVPIKVVSAIAAQYTVECR